MSNQTLVHNAGIATIRTPLLWFFSALCILTTTIPLLWVSAAPWVIFLYFLLIPIQVLVQAGEIRSVQMHYFKSTESVISVIKFCVRRLGALIRVLFILYFFALIVLAMISCPLYIFLHQGSTGNMSKIGNDLVNIIVYPVMIFAQCAIVISDLPAKSSAPIFFRVVKKDTKSILGLVIVFGVLRYLIGSLYPKILTNNILTIGYILLLLILEAIQAAFFTTAYLHYLLKQPKVVQPGLSPQ